MSPRLLQHDSCTFPPPACSQHTACSKTIKGKPGRKHALSSMLTFLRTRLRYTIYLYSYIIDAFCQNRNAIMIPRSSCLSTPESKGAILFTSHPRSEHYWSSSYFLYHRLLSTVSSESGYNSASPTLGLTASPTLGLTLGLTLGPTLGPTGKMQVKFEIFWSRYLKCVNSF